MIVYTVTIFVGAFLLFQVQPLIAKQILPWFGGGPGVWTACMLFFQVFLLVGYAYAHFLEQWLGARRQAWVHLGVLVLSLAFASIAPGSSWKPTGSESPTLGILVLLAANVGVPFIVLASTSPMLTRWYSLLWPTRPPYRLYALSNAGSLLALLSYPFVLDPMFAAGAQARLWSGGYVLFVLLGAMAALTLLRQPSLAGGPEPAVASTEVPSAASGSWRWIAMAAIGSALLLSTTSEMTQNVAVVPLLWVLPLAIYLVSFILCFEHDRWYRRDVFLPLLAVSSVGVAFDLASGEQGWVQLFLALIALFAGTMVCHGELARLRPAPQHLTRFYLSVALGGALGGLFVSVVAPRVFPGYWEYGISLVAALGVGFTGAVDARWRRVEEAAPSAGARGVASWRLQGANLRLAWLAYGLALAGVMVGIGWREYEAEAAALESERTFFGVLRIVEREAPSGPTRLMMHGRIAHGSQFIDPDGRRLPTTYFGFDSGIGIALERYRALGRVRESGLRMAVLGMGVGTLSVYAVQGDLVRFYEIDPEVVRLAREHFTYLEDSPAQVEIAVGDARLMLERERAQAGGGYDVIVVDVFSGDAIPVHLLTRQAYRTYIEHLRPGGLIAINVSNRYLDLAAVVRGLAEEVGQRALRVVSTADPWWDTQGAWWVLASTDDEFLDDRAIVLASTPWSEYDPEPLVWTDETANLFQVMTRGLVADRWESAPNLGHFVVDRADLLSFDDEVRIRTLTRALYSDTGGSVPIAVVTTDAMPEAAQAEASFEEFVATLFEQLGMTERESEHGMLIFVSLDDRQAAIHVGRSWSKGSRSYINRIFVRTAIEGLSAGQASSGLADAVESLAEFVRQQAS